LKNKTNTKKIKIKNADTQARHHTSVHNAIQILSILINSADKVLQIVNMYYLGQYIIIRSTSSTEVFDDKLINKLKEHNLILE